MYTFQANGGARAPRLPGYATALVHADTNIYPLSPTLASVNAHYDAVDFQSLTQVFPSSTFGFEDVNSLLQIISENSMVQEQLSSLFQHSDSSSTVYLPSHVLGTTSSAS